MVRIMLSSLMLVALVVGLSLNVFGQCAKNDGGYSLGYTSDCTTRTGCDSGMVCEVSLCNVGCRQTCQCEKAGPDYYTDRCTPPDCACIDPGSACPCGVLGGN